MRLLRHQYPRELLYCTPEEGTIVSKRVACIYCDGTAEHSRASHRNTQKAGTPTCQKDERISFLPSIKSRLQIDSFSNGDQGKFALGLYMGGGGGGVSSGEWSASRSSCCTFSTILARRHVAGDSKVADTSVNNINLLALPYYVIMP